MSRILCAAVSAIAVAGAWAPLDGQQVVTLPARDNMITPSLTDVFRVGKAEGASWELYGERGRIEVAFDGAGNLHVFDPQNFRVVVVSPTGQFVREIGKRGEGPGEIRSPAGFAVMRDGTVVIADFGARSFAIYDNQGVWQRSVPLGGDGSLTVLGALAADPRGGSVVSSGQRMIMMQAQGTRVGGPGAITPPSGRPITRYPLSETLESRLLHSAWQPPQTEATPQTINTGRGGALALSVGNRPRAFEPQLFTGVLPDGSVVFSDSSAYSLKVIGPDGGLRRVFQRALRPRAVTEAMQKQEKDRRLEEMAAGGGPRMTVMTGGPGGASPQPIPQAQIDQMMRQQIETLQFYPELPVVTGLAAGWTGKVWVARRGNDTNGPGPIDVLGAAGEYLGTIAANGPRTPNAFGPNGLAAYIETDQFEVVQIAVRRLPAELR